MQPNEYVENICNRLSGVLPDESTRESLLSQLRPLLLDFVKHGDQQALPNLNQQVNAVCDALESGDTDAAIHLAGEWGPLAKAFGIDIATLAR